MQSLNLASGQTVPFEEGFDASIPILDAEATQQIMSMVQSGTPNAVVNGVRVQNGLSNNQVWFEQLHPPIEITTFDFSTRVPEFYYYSMLGVASLPFSILWILMHVDDDIGFKRFHIFFILVKIFWLHIVEGNTSATCKLLFADGLYLNFCASVVQACWHGLVLLLLPFTLLQMLKEFLKPARPAWIKSNGHLLTVSFMLEE